MGARHTALTPRWQAEVAVGALLRQVQGKRRKGGRTRTGKEASKEEVEGAIRDLSRHQVLPARESRRQLAAGVEEGRVRVRAKSSTIGTPTKRQLAQRGDGAEGLRERALYAVREWAEGKLDQVEGGEGSERLKVAQLTWLVHCRKGTGKSAIGPVAVQGVVFVLAGLGELLVEVMATGERGRVRDWAIRNLIQEDLREHIA